MPHTYCTPRNSSGFARTSLSHPMAPSYILGAARKLCATSSLWMCDVKSGLVLELAMQCCHCTSLVCCCALIWLGYIHPFSLMCSLIMTSRASCDSSSHIRPQNGQDFLSLSAAGSHLPVFQPAHRSSSGTPRRAVLMCTPHPAHVNFPHVLQGHLTHMLWTVSTMPFPLVGVWRRRLLSYVSHSPVE